MNEIKDIKQVESLETKKDIKDIHFESDAMSFTEAKDYLHSEISSSKEGENRDSYRERLKQTPISDGHWTGERGESKFILDKNSDKGKGVKKFLDEAGVDGVEYKNAEPIFSPFSIGTVQIEGMSAYRTCNFGLASEKLAQKWNEEKRDNKDNWTAGDIKDYKDENNLTWHERCDTKTMDLVPTEINLNFSHSGGVAECKARDNMEDKFDE